MRVHYYEVDSSKHKVYGNLCSLCLEPIRVGRVAIAMRFHGYQAPQLVCKLCLIDILREAPEESDDKRFQEIAGQLEDWIATTRQSME